MAHLVRDPHETALGRVALGVGLDKFALVGVLGPPLFEERDVEVVRLHPSRLADDRPKEAVLVLPLFPPERALLARSRDAARDGLVDINVLDTAFVLVVLDEQIDAERDHPTRDPANALELKDGVNAGVREGLVLRKKVSEEMVIQCGGITMVNLPEMLRMVKSAGTAMAMGVVCKWKRGM